MIKDTLKMDYLPTNDLTRYAATNLLKEKSGKPVFFIKILIKIISNTNVMLVDTIQNLTNVSLQQLGFFDCNSCLKIFINQI